jgi:flagellar capping protein FliD
MKLKQKIWDYFKQKEDIVDHELVKKIGISISDLNRRIHNLEMVITDLEKKQLSSTGELNGKFDNLKDYIKKMDSIYSFEISRLKGKQNGN